MKTLILAEGSLTPSCSKSHVAYSFNVKREISRLEVNFTYEPKRLEDMVKAKELIIKGLKEFTEDEEEKCIESWQNNLPIQNLLTISLDDSEHFRGCAHRQSPSQNLFIENEKASYGLIPGSIKSGQWTVTISVHAVVTETCRYSLEILEVE